MLSRIAVFLVLGFGCFSLPSAQPAPYPIATVEARVRSVPLAIYSNIGADRLNQMLIDSFSEFHFSLFATRRDADGSTVFLFSYPVDKNGKYGTVIYELKVDGAIVKNKCANCFLRWGRVLNERDIGKLPWMAQYDLSSRLYPDIDQAHASIKNKSLNYLDLQHGFDYKNMWGGERNRPGYDNSYVNVKLLDLKRELVRAFTDSGFILLNDSNPAANASDSVLAFSFPTGGDRPDGVAYAVRLSSQFDADGLCYPCEAGLQYDPYQTLPPAGLSAMASRLTLASRFESGLNSAYDQIKASTERYLRPRTQFIRPPKFPPPGSARPHIMPMPVT